MPVNFETFSYPQYNLYNQTFRGQQRNVSGGESTGSMAKLGVDGSESTGSMADTDTVTISSKENGDKICFRGRNENGSGSNAIIKTLAGATVLMILSGVAHKNNWLSKLGEGKFKDFVVKYLTEPSYKACSWLKGKGTSALNWAKGIFKK